MKFLVIGGTVFLGRHLVQAALDRGHEVTLFNRGQHNPELFPEIEKLRGNRDGDLDALKGRTWDAVIDTCGYYPRIVRQSAQLLKDSANAYCFISSISAYSDFSQPGISEETPLATMDRNEAEAATSMTNETYGPLKVLCEEVVEVAFRDQALLIRPGMIVGPNDPTDRFTYLVARAARGGEMILPGGPDQRMEIIDVRDLAEWNIGLLEQGKGGAYNVTGPDYRLTVGQVLDEAARVGGAETKVVDVPASFLEEQEVPPHTIYSWYVPQEEPEYLHMWDVDCSKAIKDGLTYRPLAETVRDTVEWSATRPADYAWRVGLTPEKETELLAAWEARE